jgi:hypothetical protein
VVRALLTSGVEPNTERDYLEALVLEGLLDGAADELKRRTGDSRPRSDWPPPACPVQQRRSDWPPPSAIRLVALSRIRSAASTRIC